jgi:SAM-dependent MidA family methyltransferase
MQDCICLEFIHHLFSGLLLMQAEPRPKKLLESGSGRGSLQALLLPHRANLI